METIGQIPESLDHAQLKELGENIGKAIFKSLGDTSMHISIVAVLNKWIVKNEEGPKILFSKKYLTTEQIKLGFLVR